jgi:hypothetical protein
LHSQKSSAAEADPGELRRIGFTVVATCFIFNVFSRGIGDAFTVMVLPLEREFGWTRAQLTGIYSTYLLVSGLAGPWVGMLFGVSVHASCTPRASSARGWRWSA